MKNQTIALLFLALSLSQVYCLNSKRDGMEKRRYFGRLMHRGLTDDETDNTLVKRRYYGRMNRALPLADELNDEISKRRYKGKFNKIILKRDKEAWKREPYAWDSHDFYDSIESDYIL